MNYEKIYHLLIEKAENRCILPSTYKEKHHIVPKCLGGMDAKSNIIELFPEEHFVAHQLLSKMHKNNHKLIYAMRMMCVSSPNHKRNNKEYGWMKKRFSATQKGHTRNVGEKNHMFGKRGKNNPNFGRKHYPETLLHMSEKAKNMSSEHKRKLSEAASGVPKSETHRKNISLARKDKKTGPQKIVTCPHCNKEGGQGPMKRWHFDNCKSIPL